MCDATLLVLRAEKSTRRGSRHAVNGLLAVGAQLVGAVVNDVPRHGNYSSYYYGYGYGYGERSEGLESGSNGRKPKVVEVKPVDAPELPEISQRE